MMSRQEYINIFIYIKCHTHRKSCQFLDNCGLVVQIYDLMLHLLLTRPYHRVHYLHMKWGTSSGSVVGGQLLCAVQGHCMRIGTGLCYP